MSWLKNLLNADAERENVDYYQEGLDLLGVGKYHEAVTSFRLALREMPADPAILQQIAIAYTRIGMTGEAIKVYRGVLERNPRAVGAHYGLAFLMLREGQEQKAVEHLESFLAAPPDSPEAGEHVAHARDALAELTRKAEAHG